MAELTKGRTFVAAVRGDDPVELEAQALLSAHEFFGISARLEISPQYVVHERVHRDEGEPRYDARIPVHELIPGEESS